MNDKVSFASENFSGAHPSFLEALSNVNKGSERSYGKDDYTAAAIELIRKEISRDCEVLFAFNGTGANNIGLACITKPYSSIFCSDLAHIYVDESTAPEAFIQCRLYSVPSENGKIIISRLEEKLRRFGDVHHPQPSVVSISQPTEYGTIYSADEMHQLKKLAEKYNMKLHVDGARFFNAAAALNISLYDLTKGIDVLTLGGTKNGMMFGEAVIFFNKEDANQFHLKRSMQLASKMRFISAQFKTMLSGNLWFELASHANKMAAYFAAAIENISQVTITRPVDTNAVFVKMSNDLYVRLQHYAIFYVWNERTEETRFMFSFDNTTEEIDHFVELLEIETEKLA